MPAVWNNMDAIGAMLKTRISGKRARQNLSQGPADLQSAAPTTELCTWMLAQDRFKRACASQGCGLACCLPAVLLHPKSTLTFSCYIRGIVYFVMLVSHAREARHGKLSRIWILAQAHLVPLGSLGSLGAGPIWTHRDTFGLLVQFGPRTRFGPLAQIGPGAHLSPLSKLGLCQFGPIGPIGPGTHTLRFRGRARPFLQSVYKQIYKQMCRKMMISKLN